VNDLQILAETSRWGRLDLTEYVGSWRFTTRAGVGFATAEVSLGGAEPTLWVLQDHDADDELAFYGWSEVAWSGLLAGAGLSGVGQRLGQLDLWAEGEGLRLRDEELWRVYSTPDYSMWTAEEQPLAGFQADNNNRVFVGANGSFLSGDEGCVSFPEDDVELGGDIVRLEAHVVATIASGSWIAEIREGDGTVLWSTTAAAETDVALTVGDAAGLVVALRATADGGGEATVRLTQVVVRTVYPATSSDVATAILAATSLDAVVTASGVAADRATWQGGSMLAALEEMAALGDGIERWLVYVYEGTAHFGPWPSETAPTWRLERSDLARWRVNWRRDGVVNAVRAELPDGWRSSWITDSDSLSRWGRREMTLGLPMTTRDEAERLATVFLEERAWPVASLDLSLESRCHKPDGSSAWPAWMIRAGDLVTLHDVIPGEDTYIHVAETEVAADGVHIVPRGVDSRLDVMLAAMERRL
jgi:hypothetical protein